MVRDQGRDTDSMVPANKKKGNKSVLFR
jgi:hypothetical protein